MLAVILVVILTLGVIGINMLESRVARLERTIIKLIDAVEALDKD